MSNESRLGELLVQQGLVTEAQLTTALTRQRTQDDRIALGQILVNQRIVTQRQLDEVLDTFGKRARLGEVLIRHGAITREQLTHALATPDDAAISQCPERVRWADSRRDNAAPRARN